MAAKDLITLARAYQSIASLGGSGQDAALAVLITACSDTVEKYCRRSFYARTIDELYDGGRGCLQLREYPVQSVTWVRYGPEAVLEVKNTSALVQRATVAVGSTGLTLVSVASGVVTTTTSGLTYSGNVTLQALATAIAGVSGWTAQVRGSATGDYGLWPSADLYVTPYLGDGTQSQPAKNARGVWAGLRMHLSELEDYEFTPDGVLYRQNALPWPAGLVSYEGGDAFPRLPGYWRVKYTAGYTTIPEAVQEACARWVASSYYLWQRDPYVSQTVPASGTTAGYVHPGAPARDVADLLAPFRRVLSP